jgi:hypothetical protein
MAQIFLKALTLTKWLRDYSRDAAQSSQEYPTTYQVVNDPMAAWSAAQTC